LYLDSVRDPDNHYQIEVFFVNNSGNTLEWVKLPEPMLYKSSMSEAENIADYVEYLSVQSNEAVKVADFHSIFDSDFLHQLDLVWKATGEPEREVRITGKGTSKFEYKVLEWLPDAS
jgi:hypothetical protein